VIAGAIKRDCLNQPELSSFAQTLMNMKCWTLEAMLAVTCGCSHKIEGGPNPPFKALGGLTLVSVEKTSLWVRGYYQVKWTYKGHYDASILDPLASEATKAGGQFDYGSPKQFGRTVGGVHQLVEVGRAPDDQTKPGGWVNDGRATVLETPLLTGPLPAGWWAKAVSPNPPTPLVVSPFDGKTMPAAVAYEPRDGRSTFSYVVSGDMREVASAVGQKVLPLGLQSLPVAPGEVEYGRKGPNGDFIGFISPVDEPGLPDGKTVVWWSTRSRKL
jgi:hypothetical protein